MKYYMEAKEMFDEEAVEFTGGVSQKDIENTEKKLGVTLPESYKAFLQDCGAGDVGGEVILGITLEEDEELDMTVITLNEREQGLPKNMVIVYYGWDDDMLYCLDTSQMKEKECPVAALDKEYHIESIVAASFGEFLYQMVEDEDEDWE